MRRSHALGLGVCLAMGSALSARAAAVPDWIVAPPPVGNPPRTAVNPCKLPPVPSGPYGNWVPVTKLGLLMPLDDMTLPADGGFDLLVHFHGSGAAQREVRVAGSGVMLVAIDAGVRSGQYSREVGAPAMFEHLLDRTEMRVRQLSGRKDAKIRRLAVSAWSAGYGALVEVLRSETSERIDALLLLDSLHSAFAGPKELDERKLAPFVRFARRAAKGERMMVVHHSAIVPPGYASTTLTSRYLAWKAGGRPTPVDSDEYPEGPPPFEEFSKGNLLIRGYTGTGRRAHCMQMNLLSEVIEKHLEPRWASR